MFPIGDGEGKQCFELVSLGNTFSNYKAKTYYRVNIEIIFVSPHHKVNIYY